MHHIIGHAAAVAGGLLVASAAGTPAEGNASSLLELIPADFPVTAVVTDPQRLDETVAFLMKRLDPDSLGWSVVEDLRGDLPIGEWIDFHRPIGIAGGDGGPPLLWAQVPQFEERMGRLEGAVGEEDLWRISLPDGKTLYARRRGEYVVAAMSMTSLDRGTKLDRTLAQAAADRLDLGRAPDAIIHLNMAALREGAASFVAELAALGPLVAMLAEQQSGREPTALATLGGGLLDAAHAIIRQAESLDLVLNVDAQSVTVTAMASFNDGPIRQYLAGRAPPRRPFFSEFEARPYLLAVGYDLPGETSPVLEHLMQHSAASPSPSTGEAPAAAKLTALVRGVDRVDMVISGSPHAPRLWADAYGPDLAAVASHAAGALEEWHPLLARLTGVVGLERLGRRTIAEHVIEEFAVRPGAGAAVLAVSGEQPRLGLGVVGERLRVCLGTETDVNGRFGLSVANPLAEAAATREALAALPLGGNVVVLFDAARLLVLVGAWGGTASAEPSPASPPVAVSLSLGDRPARLDVRIPIQALESLQRVLRPRPRLDAGADGTGERPRS